VPRVTLRRVGRREIAIVKRLLQLYIYDLVGERWGVERDGTYAPSAWHRHFWRRDGRYHFVVRVGGRPAGFALVRELPRVGGLRAREMAEFFVLRTYRRRGVGTRVARALFARFPGRWELSVLTSNATARPFWRRLIRRVAVGRISTYARRKGEVTSIVWRFETGTPRTRSDVRRSRTAAGARSSA
jgi:predicted acetyltransferase